MPLVIPQAIPAPSIAAIWAYATRTLTDPDSYKADVSALLTKAYFDSILTAVRLGYIDSLATPANFMADVSALALEATLTAVGAAVLTRAPAGEYDTEMARITAARATLIDSLGTPANFMADVSGLPTAAQIWAYATRNVTQQEFEQAYSSDEVQTTLNTLGSDQSLGSENITVALPPGMERVRVIALAVVIINNRTTNAQDIDLNLNVGGTEVFSEDDVARFLVDGTTVVPIAQDVTAIVTGSGVVALEAEAQISANFNVTFTVQYYLFVQYRKS